MVDREQDNGKADLVSRLFAQLTNRFVDGATIAADCQGARPTRDLVQGAERLREIDQDAAAVAEAIIELIGMSGAEAPKPEQIDA